MKTAVTHPPNTTSTNTNTNGNNIVGCHHHGQLHPPNNNNNNNNTSTDETELYNNLMANDDDYEDDEELLSSYESSAGTAQHQQHQQQVFIKDNAYTTTVVAAASTTLLQSNASPPPPASSSSTHSSPTLQSSDNSNGTPSTSAMNLIHHHGNDQLKQEEEEKEQQKTILYNNEDININNENNQSTNNYSTSSTTPSSPPICTGLSQSTPALMTSSATSSPCKLNNGNGVGPVVIDPANLANNGTTTVLPTTQQLPQSLQGLPMASELYELFSCFRRYKPAISGKKEDELSKYQSQVNQFFEKDYVISVINNKNGELCATYPPELVVIEKEKDVNCINCKDNHHHHKQGNNPYSIKKLLSQSRFARVRTRFPFPVIYFHNKNLCRSSTLSKKIEYMFQSGVNSMKKQFSTAPTTNQSPNPNPNNNTTIVNIQPQAEETEIGDQNMENLRNNDINAIKHLSVKYICDLMVENKKKKFGFYVCSSEKADMHDRYTKQFVIASTPYPGVEFFSLFNQNSHNGQDLYYAWDITEYPAELKIDNNSIPVDWNQYKSWDLLILTQNYFKLLMEYTADDTKDSGVLVHCISGWDRTPLFISLLRISLWADGEIHQSLSSAELLYLTVAYDWFLFSHQLYDRAGRGEDIFYFCFYFLEFITSMDYSVHSYTSNINRNSNNNNNNNNNNVSSNVNNNNNNNSNNNNRCNNNSNNSNGSNGSNNGIGNHRSKVQIGGRAISTSASSSTTTKTTINGGSLLDVSQSAPPTPKNNSPNGLIKLPAFITNYTSAPPTPISHSPLPNSILNSNGGQQLQGGSPSLNGMTATNAIDVPTASRKINNSAAVVGNSSNGSVHNGSNGRGYPINGSYVCGSHNDPEIGGSWQLMGSLQDKFKSLSSFGSTPKFVHPSSNSYSSSTGGESIEGEDTNSKNVSDDEDDLSDLSDNTWDPSTSFIPGILDPNNDSSTSLLPEKKKKNNKININNNNNNNVNNSPDKQQQQEENNNNQQRPIHNHSHHLTMKEIEERRKQRLMEIKSLFIAIYQQSCVESSKDSYWNSFISYLPKFG